MIVLAFLLVGLLAAAAGAFGGLLLVGRRYPALEHVHGATLNAKAAAGRANIASANAERFAVVSEALIERVEKLDENVSRFTRDAQAAGRSAAETVARQNALEQAVAGALNISLTRGA